MLNKPKKGLHGDLPQERLRSTPNNGNLK